MFEKIKMKNEMKKCMRLIQDIEIKRYRSQASLVEAILKQEIPNDEDTDYFNKYTEEITIVRDKMKNIQIELDKLS